MHRRMVERFGERDIDLCLCYHPHFSFSLWAHSIFLWKSLILVTILLDCCDYPSGRELTLTGCLQNADSLISFVFFLLFYGANGPVPGKYKVFN